MNAGHIAADELASERIEITERHRVATGQQRAEAVTELIVAVDRQRAEREAVEAALAVQDAGAAGGRTGELERRLDRLGAGAGEHRRVERAPVRSAPGARPAGPRASRFRAAAGSAGRCRSAA